MANFYKKSHQLGRSMIEMLGVLAIIGVLSIAGIAGYTKAMTKYRLNQWQADVSALFFNLHQLLQNNKGSNDLSNIDVSLFIPNSFVPTSSNRGFLDTLKNYWVANKDGMGVRFGVNPAESIYSTYDIVIAATCPALLTVAKDASLNRIILYHQKGNVQICDSCSTHFADLTVNKINEICNVIRNAPGNDAIIYFKF